MRATPILHLVGLTSTLFAAACADLPDKASTPRPVLVADQIAPQAKILSPSAGDVLVAGEQWVLQGVVADADSDVSSLRVSWLWAGAPLCEDLVPAADGRVDCTTSGVPGTDDLALFVVDGDGLVHSDSISLTVEPAVVPSIVLDAVGAQNLYSDQPLQLSGTAFGVGPLSVEFDTDGKFATFDVVVDEDGRFSASASLSPGHHNLTASVTDAWGDSASTALSLTVGGPNRAPDCVVLQPVVGDRTQEGDATLLQGHVGDADVGVAGLAVMWSSDLDGYLGEGAVDVATGLTTLSAQLSAGHHQLTLLALDETGESCTSTVSHVVGTPPEVDVRASSDLLDEGVAATFTASVDGARALPGGVSVRWLLDGEVMDIAPVMDGLSTWTTSSLSGGAHTVVAALRDGDGWTAAGGLDITVNSRPIAPVLSAPATAFSSEDVVVDVLAGAHDPDGTPVTVSYTWRINGRVTAVSSTPTLPAVATAVGEVVQLEAVAFDGRLYSEKSAVTVSIVNAPPVVHSVWMSPTEPSSADTVTCQATVLDSEGDSVSTRYFWLVDGEVRAKGPTLSPGVARGGSELVCVAQASDASGSRNGSSAAATVRSSAPVIRALQFADGAVRTNDVARPLVDAVDYDGDAVSFDYTWFVNGQQVFAGSDALDGAVWFDKNDVVTVQVTPYDAFNVGATETVEVHVADSPMVPATVAVSPRPAHEGDTLTCEVVADAYDPDGEQVSTTLSWQLGDQVWEGATGTDVEPGDQVDGLEVIQDDVWTCVATTVGHSAPVMAFDSVVIGAPRDLATFDISVDAWDGADQTCGTDVVMADGTQTFGTWEASGNPLTYLSLALPSVDEFAPTTIEVVLSVGACAAGASGSGSMSWALADAALDTFVAHGEQNIAVEADCACASMGTDVTLTVPWSSDAVVNKHQLLVAVDADTFGLIGQDGVVATVTYIE